MAKRKSKKSKNKNNIFFGLSSLGFTIAALFILLLLVAGFLLGQLYIFVRNDKSEVEVPDLVGMDYVTAVKAAHKIKLKLFTNDNDYSNDVEKDYIIEQNPAPGAYVKEGRTVFITQSLGKRDITVPNLLGKKVDVARTELEQLELQASIPSGQYHDEAPINTIIYQSPAPGNLVAIGESIKLTYSKGASRTSFEMPTLKGMTLAAALEVLDRYDLKVSRVTRVYSPSASSEEITGQVPEESRLVKRGSEIIITLTLPIHSKKLGERDFRVVVNVPESENGIEVRIIKDDLNETKEIYRDVIKGPARIEKIIEAYGATKVSIFFDGQLIREETF